MKIHTILAIITVSLSQTTAFFTATKPKIGGSPQADQAIGIFNEKYPFDRPPVKPSNARRTLPVRDIDGSLVASRGPGNKRLTDIDEKRARQAFAELARIYGPDEALEMVKILPLCLSFNYKEFGPAFDGFTEAFGDSEAVQAMVLRNPGLLACKQKDAVAATSQTMTFSYILAYTRPVGPLLLGLTGFALASLPIEAFTGIPIRSEFLKILSGN